MRHADRWIKKFQPDGPFVAARDGVLNGIVYAIGDPVNLTGISPRRRRVLYDAGRITYPLQMVVPPTAPIPLVAAAPEPMPEPEPGAVPPAATFTSAPDTSPTTADLPDEYEGEFEELFEESEAEAAEIPKRRVRKRRK